MNNNLSCFSTLVEAVRFRAYAKSEKISCTFVNRDIEEKMSYGALDEHARAIATKLQLQGAKPGDRVLLIFSSGLPLIQAFFGCLYAGCIAVPIYPPTQVKLMEKARRVIHNAKPICAILTHDHLAQFAQINAHGNAVLETVPCLPLELIEMQLSRLWQQPNLNETNIAFLQYTSGSTMHPKGVIITHKNLLDNIHKIYRAFELNEETISFSWLPPHHDMGLIGYILSPIYFGVPTYLMSPFSFLQNPLSWLQNISKYRATISGSPNFAYDYCVKRIKEEKKQGLDLSSWRIASNGAESIRKETLEHFYHAFKNYGFRRDAFFPCYGLAEATLLVTSNRPSTPYRTLTLSKEQLLNHRVQCTQEEKSLSHNLISCGHLMQTVKIINPNTRLPCNPDQVGEIWLHSDSIAKGYWKQEKETELAFHGTILGDPSQRHYLRTGDLGFIYDEELYVTGRIKDLIILYGKNHYPQDIESSILHASVHQFLGKCAAFVVQTHQYDELTIICEVKNIHINTTDQEKLFSALFDLIYQMHQLEIHHIVLIPLKSIPHTTSGKIRRNFCRKHLLDGTLPIVAAWRLNKIEA